MSSNLTSFSSVLACCIILFLFCKPAHAFGAGNIPKGSNLDEWVWKHGDIGDVLALVPVSFLTRRGFTKLDILRVYFGNWLRDYSQVIEIMPLSKIKEPTLRVIVSVLGFMAFGIATDEFDIKKERLGCYRPEEHIDNPRGYAVDVATNKYIGDATIEALDPRLRRFVGPKEIAIDPETGMKNYIANEKLSITTSAGYIRRKLKECIERGRSGRMGNDADRKEALIDLGALLHTLEDFSAHSNYVELALRCLGEDGVFTFVGDKCRITVPSTGKEVPPLVTGTFGPLDIFQSIIGEVDDKAAIQNQGSLMGLQSQLGNSAKEQFAAVAAQVASALQFIVQFIPGAENMSLDLEKTITTVSAAKEDPHKYDPGQVDVTQGTNELWTAIAPIFDFHGKVKRFSIEYEEELKIPIISAAKEKLSKAIDDLVYSALAFIIEPAVQYVREAIKDSKETIEKVDRQNGTYINIFNDMSVESDPSHSILAKDHFSNYLNPVAGRVATATTNWATQRVVECWDSDDESVITSKIESILQILHHPAFALASTPTFIQKTMFDIVKTWWMERSHDQLATLREALSKKGIERNADGHLHGDNNAVVDASYFTGTKGFAKDWDGAQPKLEKNAEKSLADGVVGLLKEASEAIDKAQQQLEQSAVQAEELISQGLDEANRALDKTIEEKATELERTTREAQEVLDKALEDVRRETERLAEETARKTAEAAAETQRLMERLAEERARELVRLAEEGRRETERMAERIKREAEEALRNIGRFNPWG